MMPYTLALGMPGVTEWIIIGALGLLIFGKRLPEVGRSLGKGIVEFKKGLSGIDDHVDQAGHLPPPADQPRLSAPTAAALTEEERLRVENARLRAELQSRANEVPPGGKQTPS